MHLYKDKKHLSKTPLGFREYSHPIPWCFSPGMSCTWRSLCVWQGYQPMPCCQGWSFLCGRLEGSWVLRGVPVRGRCWHSCNPGELHGPHLGLLLIRSQMISFSHQEVSILTTSQVGNYWKQWFRFTWAVIQVGNVPRLSGDDWLSFVPHLGQAADVPAVGRVVSCTVWILQELLVWAGMLCCPAALGKGHFTAQMVQSRPARGSCSAGMRRRGEGCTATAWHSMEWNNALASLGCWQRLENWKLLDLDYFYNYFRHCFLALLSNN